MKKKLLGLIILVGMSGTMITSAQNTVPSLDMVDEEEMSEQELAAAAMIAPQELSPFHKWCNLKASRFLAWCIQWRRYITSLYVKKKRKKLPKRTV